MMRTITVILLIAACAVAAGCSQTGQPAGSTPAVAPAAAPQAPPGLVTPDNLTTVVKEAVAYAKANGREKALAAFNDPEGPFVRNGVYVFSESYDGTALAEPFEQGLVGTNIRNMTDRYGVPLVKNLEETAGFGIGFVSYDYPDPDDAGTIGPKLSVVADVDGTYYVGAGAYAGSGRVYPSTGIGPATRAYTTADLTAFVNGAAAYAARNGKTAALLAFNDPKGQFADGELAIIAADYNGTVLANGITPGTANDHINLLNYHDPDGVTTIREMRDLARQGGGFSYTVAAVTRNNRTWYAPKIDYAVPVDDTYWIFSGIIVPEYEQLRGGNVTGLPVRNHTRTELYDLVHRAAASARENGKEETLAKINDPAGPFVDGDLFVWAEDFNGTVLADPYWKAGIGKTWMDYTDPYGAKTTVVSINAIRSGTGFTHGMYPDTSANQTVPIPKLMYMERVDDTWWIGSGIYGVQQA